MKTIAVLHTAKATVPMLGRMIAESYPDTVVYNWLDDSILPALMKDRGELAYVFEKMLFYAKAAEKQGAALIFNACSSVGEFQDYAKDKLSIPVVRIDDAVSDVLVERYHSIGVLATLETTLLPSANLIRKKKSDVALQFQVVEGAWEAGLAGDKERQDAMIAEAIECFLEQNEAVFLAQASMAGAAERLPEALRARIYTSPALGVASLKQYL